MPKYHNSIGQNQTHELFFSLDKISYQAKIDKLRGARRRHGTEQKFTQGFGRKTQGNRLFVRPCLYGNAILTDVKEI